MGTSSGTRRTRPGSRGAPPGRDGHGAPASRPGGARHRRSGSLAQGRPLPCLQVVDGGPGDDLGRRLVGRLGGHPSTVAPAAPTHHHPVRAISPRRGLITRPGRPPPGTRRSRSSCPPRCRSGPTPGTDGSTRRGTGTTRPAAPSVEPDGGPPGIHLRGGARSSRRRTSPRTTPTRCRSSWQAEAVGREGVDRGRARVAVRCGVPAGEPPWNTFIRCSPPGSSSSPQGNAVPAAPPRAAYSHSASVGRRVPDHAQYATESPHDTWTTGWSARSVELGLRAFGVAPVGSHDLPPPRRALHAPGGREVVWEEPAEHERPAVAFGVGLPAGGVDERCELRVGHCAPVDRELRELHVVHRTLAVARVRPLRLVAHPVAATGHRHHAASVGPGAGPGPGTEAGGNILRRGRTGCSRADLAARRAAGVSHGPRVTLAAPPRLGVGGDRALLDGGGDPHELLRRSGAIVVVAPGPPASRSEPGAGRGFTDVSSMLRSRRISSTLCRRAWSGTQPTRWVSHGRTG